MTMTKGMYSSNTPEWETPQALFDELDNEFHFDIDVCATKENSKCKYYITKEEDGLSRSWYISIQKPSVCWMNPPYGREIGKWMNKAVWEWERRGNTVVCLVPARTDTAWWHDYAMRGR